MVLGPAVKSCSCISGTHIPYDGLVVKLTVDTKLYQNDPYSAHQAVESTAPNIFKPENSEWTDITEIETTVIPQGENGDGYLVFTYDGIVSKDCILLGINGNNSYTVRLVYGDDPAASVSGFSVTGGRARWKVSSEYKTKIYIIEGSDNINGKWERIATENSGVGYHAVPIEGRKFNYYRLVEDEITGKSIYHSIAKEGTVKRILNNEPPSISTLKECLERNKRDIMKNGIKGGLSSNVGDGETYIIFTLLKFKDDVENYLASYWRNYGYTVKVKTVNDYPNDPDSFRVALKDTIAKYALEGANYFHLIGDANDWQAFSKTWPGGWEQIRQDYISSGYPANGQPEKDLIPTWIVPDTLPRDEGIPWYAPYFLTDRPYSDIDNDGIPDIVLARWPITEEWEVLSLINKLETYMSQGVSSGPYSVMTCVGDLDHDGAGDGAFASAVADTLIAELPSDQRISWLYESNVPDDAERNSAASDLWNSTYPSLVLIPSSYSNRSWPGNFFDQTNLVNPFNMSMIYDGTPLATVLALSCDAADIARTEDPDYGLPICHRFLVESNKGAIEWIGPTLGSWQKANELISKYIIRELFDDPDRPAAESFLLALQRIYRDYADYREIVKTADSYAFLGDPLSRFYRFPTVTQAESNDKSPKVLLYQNFPNPFNPSTTIKFSINQKEYVDISVYDINGKKIKKLISKVLPSGWYVIRWNGLNDRNVKVASGVYFCRLKTKDNSITKKMVLLR